jgi:hypothetical protein
VADVLDDVAAAGAAALDDEDELPPHPTSAAAIMATATAPAPKRARPDLNMVPLLLSTLARVPVRVWTGLAKAKRVDQLAATPRG